MNDATRMVGATLGVAIIGSVFANLYRSALSHAAVPAEARDAAKASYQASRSIAAQLPAHLGQQLTASANSGFLDGLDAGCAIGAGVCLLRAAAVLVYLPGRLGRAPPSAPTPAGWAPTQPRTGRPQSRERPRQGNGRAKLTRKRGEVG